MDQWHTGRAIESWSALVSLLRSVLRLSCLPGCGRTDLKGYRPASEHSAKATRIKPKNRPKPMRSTHFCPANPDHRGFVSSDVGDVTGQRF